MTPLDFFPDEGGLLEDDTDLLDCYPRFLVETLLLPVGDLADDESFLRLLFLDGV